MSLGPEAAAALELAVERAVSRALARAGEEGARAGSSPCACGLDEDGRRLVGRLAEVVGDMGLGDPALGVEELRENHRLVSSMRKGIEAGRLAAIRVVVAGVLAAVAAGLWMLVSARAGN